MEYGILEMGRDLLHIIQYSVYLYSIYYRVFSNVILNTYTV